jgi:LAO/AO transport system kinase
MGDSVQVFKAGILEIADIFVINKADREGADLLQKDLRVLMSLVDPEKDAWLPPICRTVATSGEGAAELVSQSDQHAQWLGTTESGRKRKLQIIEEHIVKLASELIYERVLKVGSGQLNKAVEQCFERKKDPYSVVEDLIAQAKINLGA